MVFWWVAIVSRGFVSIGLIARAYRVTDGMVWDSPFFDVLDGIVDTNLLGRNHTWTRAAGRTLV